jgi:DNA-binding NarL/FixJ family response regulator
VVVQQVLDNRAKLRQYSRDCLQSREQAQEDKERVIMVKAVVGPFAEAQRWGSQALSAPSGAGLFCGRTWTVLAVRLKLSGRELQIVRGIFNDQKEYTIAAELGVSPHTVHTERERLYRKLGINDRLQLVLLVVEEFLALTTAPGSTLPPLCANQAAGGCPLAGTDNSSCIHLRKNVTY